jgi:Holin of 3TMs, for gene-transfer release
MDISFKDPVSVLLDIGGKVIDKIWPDPAQAAAAKFELFKLQQSGELEQMAGQVKTNQEEAKSASIFVSGWRPFIGWVCGVACAWNWIGLSIAKLLLQVAGSDIELAPASIAEMMPVLMGMLGLGAYRTYEKVKGVAAK